MYLPNNRSSRISPHRMGQVWEKMPRYIGRHSNTDGQRPYGGRAHNGWGWRASQRVPNAIKSDGEDTTRLERQTKEKRLPRKASLSNWMPNKQLLGEGPKKQEDPARRKKIERLMKGKCYRCGEGHQTDQCSQKLQCQRRSAKPSATPRPSRFRSIWQRDKNSHQSCSFGQDWR